MNNLDPKEAPQGYEARRYRRPQDCLNCALDGKTKKCIRSNCSSALRADRTEVYFVEVQK